MTTIENPPRNLAHIRAAIYGQPWAITEAWLDQMCAIVETHFAGNAVDFKAVSDGGGDAEDPGFDLVNDVAIIPVSGPIFPKANLMTALSGATALSELSDTLNTALSIRPSAVIMNFDSPGGSVMGLADFCSNLHQLTLSSRCPIIGLVNPLCGSAAYQIASQCDALYSTEGGISGSIGIIAKMDNRTRAELNSGNDPVVLRTHELKGIGYGATTPNQHADLQRGMMQHMAQFQQSVVRGRPGIDIASVSTGQTWIGKSANSDPSAQDMGLIDGVTTLEKLIQQFGKIS